MIICFCYRYVDNSLVNLKNINKSAGSLLTSIKMSNKKRSQNFSNLEECFIVECVNKKKQIIENKKTDAVSWEEKKRCWEEIAREHEIKFGIKRESKSIKEKYENLKKKTKKIISDERKELFLTGGGRAKSKSLSQTQEQLVALMGATATGLENVDSDMLGSYEDFIIEEPEESTLLGEEFYENKIENTLENSNLVEEEVIPDLEKTNIDVKKSWATWNPTQLKKKRNEKLIVKKSVENISLMEAQKMYFINEEKRAAEKHECEMEQGRLKIEILKAELEIKKRNL